MACSTCGAGLMRPLFDVARYSYVACSTCASARLEPLPPDDPIELYGSDYFVGGGNGGYADYDADADLHRRNAVQRLDRVASLVGPGPHHLIDVGCGTGYVLDEAVSRGWTAVGVDVSPHARDRSAERGHQVVPHFSTALTIGGPPTVVTAFQSLEHMRSPEELIGQAVRAMPARGALAIETWDRTSRIARLFGPKWQQANPPSVVHLFSEEGIQRLLQRYGATLASLRPTSKQVSVRLVAGVAMGKWPTLMRPMRPLAGDNALARLSFSYRLGDLVTALALTPGPTTS